MKTMILLCIGIQTDAGRPSSVLSDNEKVKCDIAMVPIGGTFTMDAREAADLINVIQPEVAIPIHYGDVVGSKSDAKVFMKNVNPSVKVEIKL